MEIQTAEQEQTTHLGMVYTLYIFIPPIYRWLVVSNMFVIFPHIGNVIIPTDELIFFRGVGQPPTRW